VRYSLVNPHAYVRSNIEGFVNVLEACRHHEVRHLIYASSSSVYGAVTKMPFSVHQNVDHPVSVYGATKKATELLAHSYSHLGASKNRSYSSDATKLPANESVSFPFRFINVHSETVSDRQRKQFFEVPICLACQRRVCVFSPCMAPGDGPICLCSFSRVRY
jgi:hypothetical protein